MGNGGKIFRHLGAATVTWDGSATSEPVDVSGITAGLRLQLPSGFAGATVTYQEKVGETWYAIHKDGSAVQDTVSANAVNVLSVDLFGVKELKIVSASSETLEGKLLGSS